MAQPSSSLRVAVLMGGRSSEHDVSLASGRKVVGALDPQRFRVLPVVLDREGGWLFGSEEDRTIPEVSEGGEALRVGPALDRLRELEVDVAFLALHGPYGEDGTIQGLLEMVGLPYTGSGVLASSLAMDKERSRWIFSHVGLTIPRGLCVAELTWEGKRELALEQLRAEVPLPWVVKPADQGSSVAITMLEDDAGLDEALQKVFRFSPRALVEERIEGEELTCGVLERPGGEALQALPVTLIRPREDAFFDYHAKYTPGATEEITPAPIEEETAAAVRSASLRAFLALGCRGMARFDYMERGGRVFLLEGNTIPGMTETSLLPQAAEAAGLTFPALLARLVELALQKAGSGPAQAAEAD